MDADERTSNLGLLSLWAAAVLFASTAFLSQPLGIAGGVLGGIALATGLATTVFAPDPGDNGGRQASRPPEDGIGIAAEPQPAIRPHVDAPVPVRHWLERVERSAQVEAAKRSR